MKDKKEKKKKSDWGSKGSGFQAEGLENQILGDVFGFESEVATEGSSSFFLYYGNMKSTTRNMQLLCMLLCSYWLSSSDIPEILQRDNHSISLEL